MSPASRNGEHLAPTSRLWPDEECGPWLLTFRWQVINGRAECVGLEISSARPGGHPALPDVGQPVTTGVLRSIALAELVADERYRAEHLASRWHDDEPEPHQPVARMRPATLQRLERAAATYRAAWSRGEPPTKAVAHRMGISEGAAANLVMRARVAGLLPPTSPGRAGGVVDDASDRKPPRPRQEKPLPREHQTRS